MSSNYNPKTITDLMKHLRENRGINATEEHARQMLNYGYYHAYKGYRFFKNPKSYIPYTSFEQIISVIDYDNGLKAAFYPVIMFLETALKNIVVASIIDGLKNAGIDEVFKTKMSDDTGNETLQKQRAQLKRRIEFNISKRYNQKNPIIDHFCEKGDIVPIWAVFEILSLSDFAMFFYCLNKRTRVAIMRSLNMTFDDGDNQLLSNILYALKDLRNALAHNNVIFDTRFKDREVAQSVSDWLFVETSISGIDFGSILDYYTLIEVVLKKIEYEDEKIWAFIFEFENCLNLLKEGVPDKIFIKLTTTKVESKLNGIRAYINEYTGQ